LGIVKHKIVKAYFDQRTDYDSKIQTTLLGEEMFKTIKNYPIQPRIRYKCERCKNTNGHNQQVLEWGVYEWIRKHPDNIDQVWNNLGLFSDKSQIFFFVGNQFLHRTSFMIIKIISLPLGTVSQPLTPLKKVEDQI